MPSRLPVDARRGTATFDKHVSRSASNVFDVPTLSGTVEMARVSTSRDLAKDGNRFSG